MNDPNNLEGTRTPEELAENFRELDRIAPTPAEKFQLMFGQPRKTMNEESQTATYEDFWKELWDQGTKLEFKTNHDSRWIDLVKPTFDPSANVEYRIKQP
jgi:hypothetical protein